MYSRTWSVVFCYSGKSQPVFNCRLTAKVCVDKDWGRIVRVCVRWTELCGLFLLRSMRMWMSRSSPAKSLGKSCSNRWQMKWSCIVTVLKVMLATSTFSESFWQSSFLGLIAGEFVQPKPPWDAAFNQEPNGPTGTPQVPSPPGPVLVLSATPAGSRAHKAGDGCWQHSHPVEQQKNTEARWRGKASGTSEGDMMESRAAR